MIIRERKSDSWVKGTSQGGVCFTISLDNLEQILKTGELPYNDWQLKENEFVKKFVFEDYGVTVIIGSKN